VNPPPGNSQFLFAASGADPGGDPAPPILVIQPAAVVPEPSTLALLALGGGALAVWRRWRGRAGATA
jgi:hypothetical protein